MVKTASEQNFLCWTISFLNDKNHVFLYVCVSVQHNTVVLGVRIFQAAVVFLSKDEHKGHFNKQKALIAVTLVNDLSICNVTNV